MCAIQFDSITRASRPSLVSEASHHVSDLISLSEVETDGKYRNEFSRWRFFYSDEPRLSTFSYERNSLELREDRKKSFK